MDLNKFYSVRMIPATHDDLNTWWDVLGVNHKVIWQTDNKDLAFDLRTMLCEQFYVLQTQNIEMYEAIKFAIEVIGPETASAKLFINLINKIENGESK